MNKETVIFGASGFVGSNFGEEFNNCLKPGSDVVDLTVYEDVLEYLNKHKPKNIVNMAAFVAGFLYNKDHNLIQLRKNSLIALNVAAAIQELDLNCYYLYISSACVYGKNENTEQDIFVSDPNINNYGYGHSKRLGHIALKSLELDNRNSIKSCILIPTNMFGPHDDFRPRMSHVIPNLIRQMFSESDQIPVLGNPYNQRDFMFCEDLCKTINLCLKKQTTGTFNVSTGQTITILELVDKLVHLTGYKGEIYIEPKSSKSNADIRFLKNDQIKNELQITQSFFTDIDLALQKTIKWYKQNAENLEIK